MTYLIPSSSCVGLVSYVMKVEDFLESAAILRDKLSEVPYPAGK